MVLKVKRFNFIFYNAFLLKTTVPTNDSYSKFTHCKTIEISELCYVHGMQLLSLKPSLKYWLLCDKQCSILVRPESVDTSIEKTKYKWKYTTTLSTQSEAAFAGFPTEEIAYYFLLLVSKNWVY